MLVLKREALQSSSKTRWSRRSSLLSRSAAATSFNVEEEDESLLELAAAAFAAAGTATVTLWRPTGWARLGRPLARRASDLVLSRVRLLHPKMTTA